MQEFAVIPAEAQPWCSRAGNPSIIISTNKIERHHLLRINLRRIRYEAVTFLQRLMTLTVLWPISLPFAVDLLQYDRTAIGAVIVLSRYIYKPSKGFRLTITARFWDLTAPRLACTNAGRANLDRQPSFREVRPEFRR